MPGLRPEGPLFIAPRAGLLVLALATLALGCASVQGGGHAAGAIQEGRLTPGRPAAANYGPDPALSCSAEANSMAGLDLESRARESHTTAAKPDGRLCAAAEAFLGWTGKDSPDETVVIEPVPKRLALNSSASLKGHVAASYENPQVLLSNAVGELETPKMPPGKAFQAELKCGDKP